MFYVCYVDEHINRFGDANLNCIASTCIFVSFHLASVITLSVLLWQVPNLFECKISVCGTRRLLGGCLCRIVHRWCEDGRGDEFFNVAIAFEEIVFLLFWIPFCSMAWGGATLQSTSPPTVSGEWTEGVEVEICTLAGVFYSFHSLFHLTFLFSAYFYLSLLRFLITILSVNYFIAYCYCIIWTWTYYSSTKSFPQVSFIS